MIIIVEIIHRIIQLISLVVIIQVALSYFMSPFDPVRRTVDKVVNPMLGPIRKVIHPIGMFDFSPLVLIILLQLLDYILRSLLLRI